MSPVSFLLPQSRASTSSHLITPNRRTSASAVAARLRVRQGRQVSRRSSPSLTAEQQRRFLPHQHDVWIDLILFLLLFGKEKLNKAAFSRSSSWEAASARGF